MQTQKPLGIIDTLGEGFASLHRHLWIILLPVLLDALFILGPGVSFAPVAERMSAGINRSLPAATSGAQADPDAAEVVDSVRKNVREYRNANLLGVLSWQLPSLATTTSPIAVPKLPPFVAAEITSEPAVFGLTLALAAIGLFGTSFYLSTLARGVQSGGGPGVLGRSGRTWVRLVALWVMLAVVAIPVSVLAVVVGSLAGLAGSAGVSFLAGLAGAGMVLVLFYTFFLDDALVLQEVWPLPAAIASARVVLRYFWQSLGFIVLANVISAGTALAWQWVISYPPGLPAAVLGHAYVSSGLTAAGLLFFWQRRPALAPAATSGVTPPRPEV